MRTLLRFLHSQRACALLKGIALFLFAADMLRPVPVKSAPGPALPNQAAQQKPPLAKSSSFPASGIHEEIIGEITPGNEPGDAVTSGGHLAWIEKQGDYRLVFLDGKQQGGQYGTVSSLLVSADGRPCAFVAELSARQFVVVDGQRYPGEYTRIADLQIGPEPGSYAFTACLGEQCRLVANGKELGPAYQDIRSPSFTAGHEHYFYLAQQTDRWVLVHDGKEEGPRWEDSERFWISPDGRHTALAALSKHKWAWIVDGAPGPGFHVISLLGIAEDGQHYIYAGVDQSMKSLSASVVVDGEKLASYQGVGWVSLNQGVPGRVARAKLHAPYGFFEHRFQPGPLGNIDVLLPGVQTLLAKFDGVSNPFIAGPSKAVYTAKRGDKDFAVFVDGIPGPGFEDVSTSIAASKDGKHIAYAGLRAGAFVEVIDQQPGRSYPQESTEEIAGNVTLSEDAVHIGYETIGVGVHERAKRRMVVDGQAGPVYDALEIRNFQFSSDGLHHAYLVSGAKGDRDLVVFDGLESPLYDTVVPRSLRFLDSRTISFFALKDRTYVRVTEVLQ